MKVVHQYHSIEIHLITSMLFLLVLVWLLLIWFHLMFSLNLILRFHPLGCYMGCCIVPSVGLFYALVNVMIMPPL